MHLFTQFKVDNGDIANFRLGESTNNVLNFVKTQVNINGIVNTIKNNQVGGNLYFLSQKV